MAARSSDGKLIVIVGETASGKSALGIELAKKFNGEVICADSRTVYKTMDIGTAKPSAEEQKAVPHHLLDVVGPDQPFTVAGFKHLANEAIQDITRRGRLPIMVGGSGLYVDAVLFDYGFSDVKATRDPENPRHISKDEPRSRQDLRPNTLLIGLTLPRDVLQKRIELRVENMLQAGFIDEVKRIQQKYPDSKALQAPGYKVFRDYIKGTITLEEAKTLFVRNDMNLAKRQRTWFKRNRDIHWLNNSKGAVALITTFLNT